MTKKQNDAKLQLRRESLRELTTTDLRQAVGGTQPTNNGTAGYRRQ